MSAGSVSRIRWHNWISYFNSETYTFLFLWGKSDGSNHRLTGPFVSQYLPG